MLRYLKYTQTEGITFFGRFSHGPQEEVKQEIFFAYTDSNYANDTDDRKAVYGFTVYHNGNQTSWSSKKQSVVAQSTSEAE